MANIPAATEEVIYSGVLRKKGARRNVWGERHFILKGHTLYYYLKATDIVSMQLLYNYREYKPLSSNHYISYMQHYVITHGIDFGIGTTRLFSFTGNNKSIGDKFR